MAHSIIGFHYSTGGNKDGTGAWISGANQNGIPVGLKGVSDYGLIYEATEKGNQYGIDNWLVYRLSKAAGSVSRETPNYTVDPVVDAGGLAAEVLSKLPPEFDKAKVWVELLNEPRGKWTGEAVWNNLHPVDYLGKWCHAAASYLNARGFKFCGPSFNSGEPGDDGKGLGDAVIQYGQPGMLKYLTYCAANPNTAALAVHDYIWDLPAPQYPQLWGRWEAAIAAADLAGIPRTFSIFVTEFGYSPSNAPGYPAVALDLDRYNQISARFPQVKFAAAWTLQSGYGDISNDVITWTNYPIDKEFSEGQQPAVTHSVFGGTLPADTGDQTMQTYSFEDPDWTVLTDRLQQPKDMILTVIAPGSPLWYPGGLQQATGTVEALHKGCNFVPPNLPPHQCADGSDPLVLDGDRCYKIQAVDMASGTSLKYTFPGTGRKRVTIPVQVHWQVDQPNEVDDVIVGVLLNEVEIKRLQHPELKDRTWHYVTGEADGPVTVELRFQTSYRNRRDLFTDKWTDEELEPMTWQEQVEQIAKGKRVLAYRAGSSLQVVPSSHGFQVATNEFDFTRPDGSTIRCRETVHPITAERRIYYAVIPNWSDVRWWIVGGSQPDNPFEFKAYPVPSQAYFITSPFNAGRPSYPPTTNQLHEGVDLRAPFGTAIAAVADGVIDGLRTDPGYGYGTYVRIKHNDRYLTWYGHLKNYIVQLGQSVTAGQVIGYADSTGDVWPAPTPTNPTAGTHLHLTLVDLEQGLDGYIVNKVIDPKPFLDALPPSAGVSMPPYFLPANGDYGDICILANNWGQGDERQQLQRVGNVSYVTKNNQWERRRIASDGIYLEMDTSPGGGQYYTISGSSWLPLLWGVGDEWLRFETVSFYRKSDCRPAAAPYTVTNKIRFAALHPSWTSAAGVTLNDVIELQWLIGGNVEETYHFAPGKGLVSWANRAGKKSWVTEIIPVGQQGNNQRETGCFST